MTGFTASILGGRLLPVLPGAMCKGRDPGLWFPGPGESMARAKAVCRACPARRLCLQWALEANEPEGVWGGTSPAERDRIRREHVPGAQPGAAV